MYKAQPTSDEALLDHIRKTYDRYVKAWEPIYTQGSLDMQALSIDGPWPKEERNDRKLRGRPCEHFDVISQHNSRVTNQARMNKRSIKITPQGSGANDKTAVLREDRFRQIQYESKADQVRMMAFQNAVDRSYGFYEIATDFINARSFNQKIIYRPIPNPDSVLLDPDAKEFDFSDMEEAFKIDRMSHEAFKAKWPESEIASFGRDEMNMATKWLSEHSIQVAQYWRVEKRPRRLIQMEGETNTQWFDELPEGSRIVKGLLLIDGQAVGRVVNDRTSEERKVVKRITNGLEILETVPWLGSTIPIIVMIGRQKYVDGKREIESLTRKQRAPQLAYDVAATGEIEVMGMTPKSKWVLIDGQVEGYEDEWKDANRTSLAYLRYRAKMDSTGDALLPAPERIDYEPPVQAYEMAKDSALRAVQNAAGMTSAERIDRVAKSGIAQKEINQSADVAAYHFTDNFDIAVEYDGRIVNELLDKIEDSEREVGIRKADDSYEVVQLAPTMGEDGQVMEHPYGDGDQHSVTISTGPSFESQREAAQETANQLLSNEAAFPLVGWLAIKMLNLGAYGDKMSDLLKLLLPPDARAQADGGESPIPPEAIQAMEQAKQQVAQLDALAKQMQAKIIELEDEKQAKVLDLQGKKEIAVLEDATKRWIEEKRAELEAMKLQAAIHVAELQSRTTLMKTHEELTTKEELADNQSQMESAFDDRQGD